MSEILLRADEARGHAQAVMQRAADSQQDMEALRSRLLPLADSFKGRSAEAFDARIEEWQTSAKDLLEALDSLGQFLNGAADSIEQTDQQIADQLG